MICSICLNKLAGFAFPLILTVSILIISALIIRLNAGTVDGLKGEPFPRNNRPARNRSRR